MDGIAQNYGSRSNDNFKSKPAADVSSNNDSRNVPSYSSPNSDSLMNVPSNLSSSINASESASSSKEAIRVFESFNPLLDNKVADLLLCLCFYHIEIIDFLWSFV